MKFNIGDPVSWVSQANGSRVRKVGRIVKIIPANRGIRTQYAYAEFPASLKGSGFSRDHESYVVECVVGKRGGTRLYWPRVSQLVKGESE